MTVWGHWTLCGLCPGSTHLLYEICSLFVCWETLFALEYSVWGWPVSGGHVHTSLRIPKTYSQRAPSRRLSMQTELCWLLGSLHSSNVKWRVSADPQTQSCSSSPQSDAVIDVMDLQLWSWASPEAWPSESVSMSRHKPKQDDSVGATCVSGHL